MKRLSIGLVASAASILLVGCNHKDLCFDHTHTLDIEVVYDWQNAPDAQPSSMELFLYDISTNASVRFNFQGRDGGPIRVEAGSYDAIGFNSDLTDWARFRNTSDASTFEIYTGDANTLSAYRLDPLSVPRAEAAGEERIAKTPEMLWNDFVENISIKSGVDRQIVTLYPEEAVCHYTVTVRDIENAEYLNGTELDGILSGMSESYLHGQKSPSDSHVTMPFVLNSSDGHSLNASFLTFGESPSTHYPHILTIYMILNDGSKWYSTFDVSDQIYNAPDPKHVDIVVSGLKLPKPLSSGGFVPDVNDWQDIQVDIKM